MEITQEHISWWNNLPNDWKQLFLVTLYCPEQAERDMEIYSNYEIVLDYSGDLGDYCLNLNLNNSELMPNDWQDLATLFNAKKIVYNADVVLEPYFRTLPPMHYFQKLEALSLSNNSIRDLSPLRDLKNLRYLCLHNNYLSDDSQLEHIAQCTALQSLDLSGSAFFDLSPLANLTDLRRLDLWNYPNNHIVKSDMLRYLQKLEYLNADVLDDIRVLAQLPNLKEIDIGSDEYEWDLSQIEWLIPRLPESCNGWITLPCWGNLSDKTILYSFILTDKNQELPTQFSQRLDELENELKNGNLGNYNDEFKELITRASQSALMRTEYQNRLAKGEIEKEEPKIVIW